MSRETDLILRHWRDAIPDDRIAHLIKDATRALVRALQNRLAAHDVPFGHWAFLRILWEQDGLTQRQLSAEAGVMESTTASVVRRMEKNGHIRRRHIGGNRRKMHIFLTASGKRLKQQLVPEAETVNRIALQNISSEEIAGLRSVLLTMIENLALEEAGPDIGTSE